MDLNIVTDWLKRKTGYMPQPEKQLPEGSSQGVKTSDLPLMLGMIAGPMAATASMGRYRDAALDVLAKKRPTDIFNRTGWFQRQPGQLAFEIPDHRYLVPKALKVPQGDRSWEGTLEDVIHHPPLFYSYPGIQKMPVRVGPIEGFEHEAYHYPGEMIGIGGLIRPEGLSRQQLKSLMHEGQHEVQHREKWGEGANPQDFARLTPKHLANKYYDYNAGDPERDAIAKMLKSFHLNKDSASFRMYARHPNETEARNVENRFANQAYGEPFTSAYDWEKQLKIAPNQVQYPWKTEDIPRNLQYDYYKVLNQ